ncbi:metalloprotease [Coemansia thaxteri]|nr:metalloprotease [Coemansia thaxteri]KAJ2471681.1 metalloprotease [Coemansia sp. RSA 2322]
MSRVFETLDRPPTSKECRFLPPVADYSKLFSQRLTPAARLPYTEFVGDLNKSESDVREYRLIRLSNGLTAMLIHDAAESKACAAMDVNVGSLADPPEFQGLAHFCEHLLFMGTTKYPKENEYNAYLSANGGYSNAYTDLEDTCYYFEATYDALEGALDRFSQFFIDPLFTEDCTDREVRAVDSEHKKNIQSDMWRQYQIEKELSSPAHPFSMFATGNQATLSGAATALGVDLRGKLLEFHAKYYSADIMKLVVVGRDSLDQLTEWAVSKFSPILSKGMTKPLFKGHPLTEHEMGKLISIKSIRQQRTLDLTFALPDLKPFHRSKPSRYLGSLVGHEGKGSILSFLKRRGWATSVVAGRSPTSAEGFDMFKVTVSLTELGLEKYEDVVRVVFAFLQLLQAKEPQRWFQEELQRVSEIEYKFLEKSEAVNLASNLANAMQSRYLEPESMLSDGMLLGEFDEDLIKWVQGFLVPDNLRILLAVRELDVDFDLTEQYYGVNYRVDSISSALMQDLRGDLCFDELHLPEPNCFIPDNLEVKGQRTSAEPTAEPVLLKLAEGLELWFKQDDRFFLPRGEVRISVENPRAYESPLSSILSQLFVLVLKDSLSEITYDAQVAGLWFDIHESVDGISMSVDGFNDKLPRLLRILLTTMRDHQVDDTQFEVYSREVKKKLDNVRHAEPYNHVQTNTHYLNYATVWRYSDKLSAFSLVTKQRLQKFIDSLFEQTRIQMIVTGNFGEQDALDMADMVIEVLGCQPLPDYARQWSRGLLHNAGCFMHYATMPEDGNLNSSVDVSIYTGLTQNDRERVVLDLTSLIIQEPFFDQLRTKEQLGYITYSSDRKYSDGYMALRLLVQSEANPAYVSQRIGHFMREFRKRLVDMAQDEFDRYVNSLKVRREEKLKNLYAETGRYWTHVSSGYYQFDKIDRDLANLAVVGKGDIIAFWDKYVNPETALSYTSMTAAIWSTKISQPSDVDLARYPEISIALHGCLLRDGVNVLSLMAVDEFVQSLGSLFDQAVEKSSEPASYVRTALSMAIGQASEPDAKMAACNGDLPRALTNGELAGNCDGSSSRSSLANIGAIKTPAGVWVFREASAFKATLRQTGAPIPTRPLVPKYK